MRHHRPYEFELEDASGNVYPLIFPERLLRSISGTGMPPIKHWSTRAPFQVGETHWGYAVGPRIINAVLYARGCNRADMYVKTRAMAEMLNPGSGPHVLRLVTPPPDPRKLELHNVWVTGGFELSWQDQPSPRVQVASGQLTAYDPIWKWTNSPLDAGETRDVNGRTCMETSTFTLTDELTLPFTPPFLLGARPGTATLTCTNDGSWDARPVITIEGPVYDWALTNDDTAQEITWDGYPIDTGETVTIDIPNKTITNNDGMYLGVYAQGHVGSFKLSPGANDLTLWVSGGAVSGTTTLGVCWYLEVLGA